MTSYILLKYFPFPPQTLHGILFSMMDLVTVIFPVSGVETWLILPPVIALLVSSFTSMAGVSGAFILLPFQMSVLGFTSPAVSSTNFVYNVVAIPSGVYRYFREGRMAWPLAGVIIAGTVPGVFFGYYLRVLYLPDPAVFKVFVGAVLLYVGGRLIVETAVRREADKDARIAPENKFSERAGLLKEQRHAASERGLPQDAAVKTVAFTFRAAAYEFRGERFRFSVPAVLGLAGIVGVIGGAYGIGGGAIIAPFCVTVFRLPVYTVAGAALLGTFVTSIVGVIFYSVLPSVGGVSTSPDWALGFLFGMGGFAGMYVGARLQKFVPQKLIKLLLGILILSVATKYITQYFI